MRPSELGPRGKFRYIFTATFTAYCRYIEYYYLQNAINKGNLLELLLMDIH